MSDIKFLEDEDIDYLTKAMIGDGWSADDLQRIVDKMRELEADGKCT